MSATDWAAIIGALAWVPQVFGWIRKLFARPRLALFPPGSAEVGFSTFGAVVNLSSAISASVRDAVIVNMELTLVHEKGQQLVLPWQGLHETLDETEMPTGEVERRRRQQGAQAMKVTVHALAERTVMFRDVGYQTHLSDLLASAEARRERIAATEPEPNRKAALMKSDEMANALAALSAGFPWQPGEYRATIRVTIAERRRPFLFRYRFRLTETDVNRLRDNLAFLTTLVTNALVPADDAAATSTWNWRYPTLLPDK